MKVVRQKRSEERVIIQRQISKTSQVKRTCLCNSKYIHCTFKERCLAYPMMQGHRIQILVPEYLYSGKGMAENLRLNSEVHIFFLQSSVYNVQSLQQITQQRGQTGCTQIAHQVLGLDNQVWFQAVTSLESC